MTKDTRILFDSDFYTLQAVLNSKKFNLMIDEFGQEMKSKGIPFPSNGFKTVKEYHEWSAKAHAKDIYYEGFIDNVIKEFSLEKENEDKFQLGLQWYVYFGKKKAPIKFTHGKQIGILNDEQSVKVSLTIYPWTVKEDVFDGLWEKIETEQHKLVEYKDGKRNREWENFERDFKIYELFLSIKKENSKSVYRRLVEHAEFKKIVKELNEGKNIDDSVGTIITRCKRHLKDIDLI